jgi:Kef-type K+ transport system membrane component KefB
VIAELDVLMNARGLMELIVLELIVLNVGLSLGVISPRLFAMMVVMALVTTALASPILAWLRTGRRPMPRRRCWPRCAEQRSTTRTQVISSPHG